MTHKKSIGAGMLAATAAGVAAGYYFYASKDAKKNRKIVAKWAVDLKNDVVREAKKAHSIDRKDILAIVDTSARAYKRVRDLNGKDVARAVGELKDNWQEIAKELKKGGASAMNAAKRAGKSGKAEIKRATR